MPTQISDKQWEKIQHLVPDGVRRADGRGRPWQDKRKVFEEVIWILRTGAPWKDLPAHYPPCQTCHRRFQEWQKTGVFDQVIEALARDLHERGGIDLSAGYSTAASARYRRIVVRYEYKAENFICMLLLACIMIFLKSFFYL